MQTLPLNVADSWLVSCRLCAIPTNLCVIGKPMPQIHLMTSFEGVVDPRCQEHWSLDAGKSGIYAAAFGKDFQAGAPLIRKGPKSSRAENSCLFVV